MPAAENRAGFGGCLKRRNPARQEVHLGRVQGRYDDLPSDQRDVTRCPAGLGGRKSGTKRGGWGVRPVCLPRRFWHKQIVRKSMAIDEARIFPARREAIDVHPARATLLNAVAAKRNSGTRNDIIQSHPLNKMPAIVSRRYIRMGLNASSRFPATQPAPRHQSATPPATDSTADKPHSPPSAAPASSSPR